MRFTDNPNLVETAASWAGALVEAPLKTFCEARAQPHWFLCAQPSQHATAAFAVTTAVTTANATAAVTAGTTERVDNPVR